MIDIDQWHKDYVWDQSDVAEARANGISYRNFYQRVEAYGWTVQKAKTHHIMPRQERTRKYDQKWRDMCEKHGVEWKTFIARMGEGWSKERAATTKHSRDNPVIPQHLREKARANGLPYHIIYHRIVDGKWDPEEAVTKPIMTRRQAAVNREKLKRERKGEMKPC